MNPASEQTPPSVPVATPLSTYEPEGDVVTASQADLAAAATERVKAFLAYWQTRGRNRADNVSASIPPLLASDLHLLIDAQDEHLRNQQITALVKVLLDPAVVTPFVSAWEFDERVDADRFHADLRAAFEAWDPSQTSTNVDAKPAASLMEPSAPSAAAGAGSSSSPSAAPTDSLPDPNGQEPTP